jgi:hypothetical protein
MANPTRSVAAVASGFLVAIAGVALSSVVVLFVAGQFSAAYLDAHMPMVMSLSYATNCVLVATLGGVVVGLLAPARPLIHALITAAVIVGISAIVAGTKGLPHGWQIAGLLLQVVLMASATTLTWNWRAGQTFISARSTIPRVDHH